MSGYYPPNQQYPHQYYNVNPNAVPNPNVPNMPMMAPDGSMAHGVPDPSMYHGMPGSFVQFGEPQIQQAYMDQYEDVSGAMGAAQGGNPRMRRRSAPGDHVKHRRTRSGCFTCRQRRVKVPSPSAVANPTAFANEMGPSATRLTQYVRVSLPAAAMRGIIT